MRIQRIVARTVRGLLRMRHSSMRLNTGEIKAITTRSPMGMSGTAITQQKVIEAVRKPRRDARSQVLQPPSNASYFFLRDAVKKKIAYFQTMSQLDLPPLPSPLIETISY